MSKSKHTPGPWIIDKAKWAACQWGTMPDPSRGEPNLAGGVLPAIAVFRCPDNDDHDLCVRSRRADQQDRIAWTDEERWANASLIAASPDLLEACKRAAFAICIEQALNPQFSKAWGKIADAINAAINKAEGA